MDVCAELRARSSNVTAAGPEYGQELSLSTEPCQTKNGGNILLQLLDFKRHLLEAVEELHIRRDAEARFEEQISKLVLEKQELEWQKELLQHQLETGANQHTESLSKANKQFQAKIRHIEEEKGRFQVSAELKDKEINNLKEELKSLQLLKYNLEKKASELEQKLALQSRSKDTHLTQLGEVEKRFSSLSRQWTMVKQVQEKLEQNVNAAMKLNKKLTATNEKQEATIVSLTKELEELNNKLVTATMSSVSHEKKFHNSTIKEQNIKQLHQKFNMEYEMNRKLHDENESLQAEKQEVMRSLQRAQQLLLSQTQTVSRLEKELQTQKEHYQSLEQDHKAIGEKGKIVEKKMSQLMEEYSISKTSWDKERAEFLVCMKMEQQELATVKEAYEELHLKHIELSSQAKALQAQQIYELEIKTDDQNLSVSAICTSEGGEETKSNSELSSSNNVQTLSLAKDTEVETKSLTTIAVEEQAAPAINEESQSEKSNLLNRQPHSHLSATGFSGNTAECDVHNAVSNCVSVADNSVLMSNNNTHLNSSINTSSSDCSSVDLPMEKVCQDIQASTFKNDDNVNTDKISNNREEVSKEEHKEHGWGMDSGNPETEETIVEEYGAQALETETTGEMEEIRNETQHVSHSLDNSSEPESACNSLHTPSLNEEVEHAQSNHVITRQEVLPQDLVESQDCGSNSDREEHYSSRVQSHTVEPLPSPVCHDHAEMGSEESTACFPTTLPETLNKSSLCHSQTDAAQLDGVSVQGTVKTQTQEVNPGDTTGHTKDIVDTNAKESPLVSEIVEAPTNLSHEEIPEQTHGLTDSVIEMDGHSSDKSTLKRKQPGDVMGNAENVESQGEMESCRKHLKMTPNDMMCSQKGDLKTDPGKSPKSGSSEWQEQPQAKEMEINDELSVPNKPTYRSSFEWRSAQRRIASQMSQQNMSGSCGFSSSPLPMFLKSKHNRVPMVITRATDLLNASSVCGTAASSRRLQQGEWKATGEAQRETGAQMESRVSESSSVVPTTSSTVSRPSWQTSPSNPDASLSREFDWDPSCSQDTEDMQSSFRAQISKIEHFLKKDRLRLPKRQKTDKEGAL